MLTGGWIDLRQVALFRAFPGGIGAGKRVLGLLRYTAIENFLTWCILDAILWLLEGRYIAPRSFPRRVKFECPFHRILQLCR